MVLEKTSLAAKVRRARDDSMGGDLDGGGGSAFADLQRLTGRIDALESEVEAHDVLDDPRRRDIDARFRALEKQSGNSQVDDALEDLKRRLDD